MLPKSHPRKQSSLYACWEKSASSKEALDLDVGIDYYLRHFGLKKYQAISAADATYEKALNDKIVALFQEYERKHGYAYTQQNKSKIWNEAQQSYPKDVHKSEVVKDKIQDEVILIDDNSEKPQASPAKSASNSTNTPTTTPNTPNVAGSTRLTVSSAESAAQKSTSAPKRTVEEDEEQEPELRSIILIISFSTHVV